MNGSYPLRRPLYLYINKAPKVAAPPIMAEYVKFALSAQGQQTVIAQGYYPLSLQELQRLTAAWTAPARGRAGATAQAQRLTAVQGLSGHASLSA
jgi:phosphate transport system substrate-binding protein